jgi:hypothetical protein
LICSACDNPTTSRIDAAVKKEHLRGHAAAPLARRTGLCFFDAVGDAEKFKRNLDRMMDSVNRFIDMGGIDVAPTSQHLVF